MILSLSTKILLPLNPLKMSQRIKKLRKKHIPGKNIENPISQNPKARKSGMTKIGEKKNLRKKRKNRHRSKIKNLQIHLKAQIA